MAGSDIVKCAHCGGEGDCRCDACWKANKLNPDYNPNAWIPLPGCPNTRDRVPCKVCGGAGKVKVRSV